MDGQRVSDFADRNKETTVDHDAHFEIEKVMPDPTFGIRYERQIGRRNPVKRDRNEPGAFYLSGRADCPGGVGHNAGMKASGGSRAYL